MKDLTPANLRCGPSNCPSVHELEDGRLLIVGKRTSVSAEILATMDLATEEVIIIDRALLSTIRDDVRAECVKLLRDFAAERAERGEAGPVAIRDEALSASATASLLAARIDALKETPHE